jgi:hypothetical protein
MAAISAGVTQGAGAGSTGSIVGAVAVAAINSVVSQAIGSALGIQSFSWRGVAAAAVTAGVVEAGGQLLSAISGEKIDLSKQNTGSSTQSNNGVGGIILGLPSTQVAMSTVARNVIGLIGAVAGSAVQNRGKIEWRSIAINAVGNSLGAAVFENYKQNRIDQGQETMAAMQDKRRPAHQYQLSADGFRLPSIGGADSWRIAPVEGSADNQSQAVKNPREIFGAHETNGAEQTDLPDPIERLLNQLSPASKLDSMIQLVGKGRASARYTQSARLNREDIIPVAQNARIREVLNVAEDGFGHVQQLGSLVDDIRSARVWPELMDGRVQNLFEEMKKNGFTGTIRESKEIARDPFADRRVSTAVDRIENLKVDYINQLEDQRMTRTWGPNY